MPTATKETSKTTKKEYRRKEGRGLQGGGWRKRDAAIVEAVERWRCLTVAQVARVFFPKHKYAEDKARHRLRALVRSKRLQVTRLSGYNVYHRESLTRNTGHWLMVAEAYVRLEQGRKSWEQNRYFPEFQLMNRRADLFVVTKNVVSGEYSTAIVEADAGTNEFGKVREYNDTFDLDWTREWWADLNKKGKARFPRIIVLTTRPGEVQEAIKKENRNNLRWEVCPCERLL